MENRIRTSTFNRRELQETTFTKNVIYEQETLNFTELIINNTSEKDSITTHFFLIELFKSDDRSRKLLRKFSPRHRLNSNIMQIDLEPHRLHFSTVVCFRISTLAHAYRKLHTRAFSKLSVVSRGRRRRRASVPRPFTKKGTRDREIVLEKSWISAQV